MAFETGAIEKDCPVCGKHFFTYDSQAWVYKKSTDKGVRYYCSWGCMRKEEPEETEFQKRIRRELEGLR